MGKHKPIWDPSTDCGDYVVATGCTDVYATGKKLQQKLYYKQTTRPGALKSLNMEGMIKKWGGGEILKRAVSGMLPKNRLRKPRLERLKGWFLNDPYMDFRKGHENERARHVLTMCSL